MVVNVAADGPDDADGHAAIGVIRAIRGYFCAFLWLVPQYHPAL